ncbi:MAG: GNAT family N-acetyltransferase [Nocardioides sp.]|uniref:GNAT family N-acetyltransferase n=1 Tax=Nocardioides sp. TaxID=35761 RepID=UPI003F0232C3
MPLLVPPAAAVRHSFLAAVDELVAEGRAGEGSILGRWIDGYAEVWRSPDGFDAFLSYLAADALEETPRPDGLVRQSTWWWVDGTEYVGRISVRPDLGNEFLRTKGGHVGYEVRPSRRREGHATAMLRTVLPHVRALGVDPALVTCDADNVASRKVIESAGGRYLDSLEEKVRFHLPTR